MIIYRRKGREREMRGGIKEGRGVAGPGLRKYASLRKDTKGRAGDDEGERSAKAARFGAGWGGGSGKFFFLLTWLLFCRLGTAATPR